MNALPPPEEEISQYVSAEVRALLHCSYVIHMGARASQENGSSIGSKIEHHDARTLERVPVGYVLTLLNMHTRLRVYHSFYWRSLGRPLVCYNNQKMEAKDISKHVALKVDPDEYIECIKLRQQINPVYKEVEMSAEQVKSQWPCAEVPKALILGAQGLDTLNTFKPTLDGPASLKAATCQLPSTNNAEDIIEEEQEADPCAQHGCHCPSASTEPTTKLAEVLEMPAEVMIGIREDESQDPIDLMVVFQKNLELVQEAGRRIHALEQKRIAAQDPQHGIEAAAAVTAEKAKHEAALVDLRRLASKMGEKYQAKLTDAIAAAEWQVEHTQNSSRALRKAH